MHIYKINGNTDKNKYLTTVKVNGSEKEFIKDTKSPISIMQADNNTSKKTEIQKVKYQYKNEVKFCGQLPAEIEYENDRQKMQKLISRKKWHNTATRN